MCTNKKVVKPCGLHNVRHVMYLVTYWYIFIYSETGRHNTKMIKAPTFIKVPVTCACHWCIIANFYNVSIITNNHWIYRVYIGRLRPPRSRQGTFLLGVVDQYKLGLLHLCQIRINSIIPMHCTYTWSKEATKSRPLTFFLGLSLLYLRLCS